MPQETPRILVEACVDSITTALAAEAAGANRVELCGPGNGGTTPTFGVMSRCRDTVRIPIHAMIRPREGDFVYNDDDLAIMLKDIGAARSAGVDGVVFGVLQADGRLDAKKMTLLMDAARPLRTACHRAFDLTPNPTEALDTLMQLGVAIVLTSGHSATAFAGAEVLAQQTQRAGNKIVVMAGGGVRAENVREVAAMTGVSAIHARATDPAVFSSLMQQLGRQSAELRS